MNRGIPTKYAGRTFRSKNEAGWAAFFDIAGWRWEYEQVEGRGYLPDFVLVGREPVLVEIKPGFIIEDLQQHLEKIELGLLGVWDRDVLVLGQTPLPLGWGDWMDRRPIFGLLGEAQLDDGGKARERWWGDAVWCQCADCGRSSFHHADASWRPRICGHRNTADVHEDDIQGAWNRASELVRWEPAA